MKYKEMVEKLMSSIDSKDAEKFASFLTEDASFKFGNSDPVTGNETIKQFVGGFFEAVEGLSHTIDTYLENGESIFYRGEVTYTRKDSSKLTVPYTNYFLIDNGKVKEYQIYIDNSQLFA